MNLSQALVSVFSLVKRAAAPTERKYRYQFGCGIRVTLHLSNRWPVYLAEFSEPLPLYLREQFIEFRTEALNNFKAISGMTIRPGQLERERILSFPAPLNVERPLSRDFARERENRI